MRNDTDCLAEIYNLFKTPFLFSKVEMVEKLLSIYDEYLEILKSQPWGYGILRQPNAHLTSSISELQRKSLSKEHEIYSLFQWYLKRIPGEIRVRKCAKWVSQNFIEADANQLINTFSQPLRKFDCNRILFQQEGWQSLASGFLEQNLNPFPFSHSSFIKCLREFRLDEDVLFLSYKDQDGDCSELYSCSSLAEMEQYRWFKINHLADLDQFFNADRNGEVDNIHFMIVPESRNWIICHHVNYMERVYRVSFHGEESVLEQALANVRDNLRPNG